jgi:cytochrome c-type biogenesis protein CcmH
LFVLARDPSAGGPPLAVQRHSSNDLPLTVELSERDAMMPTRTIAGVARVEVVARLSRSGTPQAQSGDFYGTAEHVFAGDGTSEATLNIIIDRTVP